MTQSDIASGPVSTPADKPLRPGLPQSNEVFSRGGTRSRKAVTHGLPQSNEKFTTYNSHLQQ